MYLDKVKQQFEERAVVAKNLIHPCTEGEIAILEQQLQVRLPTAYREFLLWMGHGAGRFWAGSDCWYTSLPKLQVWAVELLVENNFPVHLPHDAFIIFMHQGYQFDFLRLSEGENPPVYFYGEWTEQTSFKQTHNCYSDFLREEVEVFGQQL